MAGLALIFAIVPLLLPVIWILDDMLANGNVLFPYVVTLTPLSMVLFYPTCHQWSVPRSDCTLMLAVGGGIALALWLVVHGDVQGMTPGDHLYAVTLERVVANLFSIHALLRSVIGFALLAAVRIVVKLITVTIFSILAGYSSKDANVKQLVSVQLPCKFFTYSSIALAAVFLAPVLFAAIGINRPGMFFEYTNQA